MKKLIVAVLLVSMVLLPTMVNAGESQTYANRYEKIMATGKLIMGTAPGYPPYEFLDLTKTGPDAVTGCDITLGKHIAEKLGVELVIETMDFSTLLAAMGQGTLDIAISGMVPKPERAEIMEFSTPFNKDGYQGILIMKDQAEQIKSFADLEGKVILAQNGTLQQSLIEQQIPGAKMELVTTVGDGVMMVKTGKAVGIAIAGVVGELYCKSYPDLAFVEQKFEYEMLGTVAGIAKGEIELLNAINPIVEEAESSGLYAQWRDEAQDLAASQMVN